MKAIKILLLFIGIFVVGMNLLKANQFEKGKKLFSPNKEFSIELTDIDSQAFFIIRNEKTGSIQQFESLYRVGRLVWSPDSQTVISVRGQHHASWLLLFHWNEQKWVELESKCPGLRGEEGKDFTGFELIHWKIEKSKILVTYILDKIVNQESGNYFKFTGWVNAETGKIHDVKQEKITFKQFVTLKDKGLDEMW